MPPDTDFAAQAGGGNSSSDFVRKLYKMLEDPSYNQVVRWSSDGNSFVVLENEKFTKTILPKHFKHSNFASFVRQLNKYDFHKVRHNEENGETPYGKDAWEFRHPEFRADRKDNLDSIRRKAPAPRKPQQAEEAFPASQQIVVLGESLAASQHQIQALQEHFYALAHANKVLVNEVMSLQKMVKAQSQASQELIAHLSSADERRRSCRHSANSSHSSHSGPSSFPNAGVGLLPDGTDEPAPELRRAREILKGTSPDLQAERELERLSMAYHQTGSPPDSATSSVVYSQPGSALPLIQDPLNDVRHMVYPVGQNTGIDPFHQDHINNIPYSRPLSKPNAVVEVPPRMTPTVSKEQNNQLWGPKKPKILLVEDDKTCSRIGSKFLSILDCSVDTARDGLEAVNSINRDSSYFDLIFMDIIMPQLDGVSATSLIRMVAPRVPIIAMTSNIRQEDLAMYFQFGMNDVLAKPFTKDGMVRILKKHLTYMLRDSPPPGTVMGSEDIVQNGGTPVSAAPGSTQSFGGPATMTLAHMVGPMATGGPGKFENTPIQSPATSASWHSPNQMTHTSPQMDGGGYMNAVSNGNGGMLLTPGGSTQRTQFPPTQSIPQGSTSTLGRMAEDLGHGDDRPDKRQRIFGPSQGAFV